MPKVTDEELDRLFRDAAESAHPEFDPRDWEDMGQKLAHEEKAAKARNRTLYSVVTLLVLYSIWSPFGDGKFEAASMNPFNITEFTTKEKTIESNESGVTNKAEGTQEAKVPEQVSQMSVESKDSNATAPTAGEQDVKTSVQQNPTPVVSPKDEMIKSKMNGRASVRENAEGIQSATKEKGTLSRFTDSQSENKSTSGSIDDVTKAAGADTKRVNESEHARATAFETERQLALRTQKSANESSTKNTAGIENTVENENRTLPTVNNEVVEINRGAEKSASENSEDVDNGGFKSLAANPSTVTTGSINQKQAKREFPSLTLTRDRKLPLLLETVKKEKQINEIKVVKPSMGQGETVVMKDPLKSNHALVIKLLVSPDFSSIDYGSAGKTGINIGLLGEYYLTKHISVSTGAIWSKKLYDQKNPEKVYNSGSWSAKVSRLDGDCRVLDIPLNFTYYLFPQRRTNFFVTLGTSSYIMLNEEYKYTILKNQQYTTYDQSVSHKNNEWFSMLNVSIGLQQRIGQRFLFQVEPFLKAPISGVGEGKVNLVSTGAFVSLKYQLIK
ncbi:MAG: porin family protein [Chryseolinea sp.]